MAGGSESEVKLTLSCLAHRSPQLNSNLFPVLWLLPNGHVFFAANQLAMIYDPVNNIERRIPSLPNGVTVTCR